MIKQRLLGLETEYGIASTDQQGYSSEFLSVCAVQAVQRWQALQRTDNKAITWDWDTENPLRDLRGTELNRASAHPSLLTDNPQVYAPSAESVVVQNHALPSEEPAGDSTVLSSPMLTNVVLTNGGRFYVDHAHPEYSTPEVSSSLDAVLWDAAGVDIARKSMNYAAKDGVELILYKNNTDSKGAAYGAHENYLISRDIPFSLLKDALVSFFVTRPIICGAGRVGLGPHSENPGFQISQRADFVGELVGLQTTFNRPIVNTRDEPHAESAWRRLHVINGDANRFQYSTLYRLASTRAWLGAVEAAWQMTRTPPPVTHLYLATDAVQAVWQVSRDLNFESKMFCADGNERSALEWQWEAANTVAEFLSGAEGDVLNEGVADDAAAWLEAVRMLREDHELASRRIEWIAKHQLLCSFSKRFNTGWNDTKLAALDIKWADLRKNHSPIDKLGKHVEQVYSHEETAAAAFKAPADTRAHKRGRAVSSDSKLVSASWTTLVRKTDTGRLQRELLLITPR